MLLSKRLWAVLTVAVLVAGLLVGFGDGEEAVAKEPRTLRSMMIPPAAFVPVEDGFDYDQGGDYLQMYTGGGAFVAPVYFPFAVVNVRKVTLFVIDANEAYGVGVSLSRAEPATGSSDGMVAVNSTGAEASVRAFSETAISPRRLLARHAPFLYLGIDGPGVVFRGVQVVYSY